MYVFLQSLRHELDVTQDYFLSIARVGADNFRPFPRALARSETQLASCRIWTRVADSIFYNDVCTYMLMDSPVAYDL